MSSSLMYPIPRAVVRAFTASGKRHLLLTGGRGAGKSTLLGAILPLLGAGDTPDILTFARPGQAVFLRCNAAQGPTPIGVFDASLPGPDTRMRPLPEGFGPGIAALNAAPAGNWVSVDEIGYLETSCPSYCDALRAAFERCRVMAAVRKADLHFLKNCFPAPTCLCWTWTVPTTPAA